MALTFVEKAEEADIWKDGKKPYDTLGEFRKALLYRIGSQYGSPIDTYLRVAVQVRNGEDVNIH